jgi:ABC-type cobalamin/Fe3+-siderophores transport system ATPase subunit
MLKSWDLNTLGAGDPVSVLTPNNIKRVYGVTAEVNYNDGRPYIVPLKPVKQDDGGSG